MKTKITILLLFIFSIGFGQSNHVITVGKQDTIYYDPAHPNFVRKANVVYLANLISDLTITADDDTLTLDWTNPIVASSKIIEKSVDGINYIAIDTVQDIDTLFINSGLSSGIRYYYRIRPISWASASSYVYANSYTSYPNELATNTAAFYDFSNSPTITKSGVNITRINDVLGSGHDLIQADTSKSPHHTSALTALFDGSDDYLKASAFTLNQPEFIYVQFKPKTFVNGDVILDGNTTTSGKLLQYSATPQYRVSAGTVSGTSVQLALDSLGVIKTLFNGASSKNQASSKTIITGDFGAANMGGFTLAGRGTDGLLSSSIDVSRVIVRSAADDAATESKIYHYLQAKSDNSYTGKGYYLSKDTVHLETYDGSFQAMHPSVLNLGEVWNGYQYWMGSTPYPGSNSDYENPSIWASTDGTTWVVPDGLTNPVIAKPANGYNNDPDIFFENDTLYMIYNANIATGYLTKICNSSDGVTWGNIKTLDTPFDINKVPAAPSMIKIGSKYYIYYFTYDGTTVVTDNPRIERMSSNSIYGPYTNPEIVTASVNTGYVYWHLDIVKLNGYYWITAMESVSSSAGPRIALLRSHDGIHFTKSRWPVAEISKTYEATGFYRPSLMMVGTQPILFYGCMGGTGGTIWKTGKINIDLIY